LAQEGEEKSPGYGEISPSLALSKTRTLDVAGATIDRICKLITFSHGKRVKMLDLLLGLLH